MAEIFQESTWNGVAVDTYTDTTTGRIQVYSKGFAPLGGLGGVLIAESVPNNGTSDWRLVESARYRREINNQRDDDGQIPYTEAQFENQFFGDGTRHFNNNRAAVLNKQGTSSLNERQGFYDNRVPFTSNPTGNQERVNSDGTVTDAQVVNPGAVPDPSAEPEAVVPLGGAGESGSGLGDAGGSGTGSGGDTTGTGEDSSSGTENLNPSDPNTGGTTGDDNTNDDSTETSTTTNPNDTAFDDSTLTGGEEGGVINYPSITPPAGLEYDFVSFTAYDYNPSGVSLSQQQYTHGGTKYETINLPIQPTITETNSVSWTSDQLNDIQKGFANLATGGINFLGDGNGYELKKALQEGTAALKKYVDNPTTSKAMVAYFAGQAVSANIIGRQTGAIINPNLELLFSGPSLRSFNFNFRLTPRNSTESTSIRKMIRAFKRNSAVQRQSANLFLMSPRVFDIQYQYKGGGQHPYLNKIKPCALTAFNVNYTPDGSYMVFGSTGSLTSYELTLSFTELNPVFADEYGDSATDMGF